MDTTVGSRNGMRSTRHLLRLLQQILRRPAPAAEQPEGRGRQGLVRKYAAHAAWRHDLAQLREAQQAAETPILHWMQQHAAGSDNLSESQLHARRHASSSTLTSWTCRVTCCGGTIPASIRTPLAASLLPVRLRGPGRCREARLRTLFSWTLMCFTRQPSSPTAAPPPVGSGSTRGEHGGVDGWSGFRGGAARAEAALQCHVWPAEQLEARGRGPMWLEGVSCSFPDLRIHSPV